MGIHSVTIFGGLIVEQLHLGADTLGAYPGLRDDIFYGGQDLRFMDCDDLFA